MKKHLSILFFCFSLVMLPGCSVFGESGVEIAPYTVLEKEDNLELRHYDRLVLVTTAMPRGMDGQNTPFYKLFDYISGENKDEQKISMTAPVFMDQADKTTESMSFVLPKNFTIETAPTPQDPAVKLEELTDYTVATITFNGLLRQNNIDKHKTMLEAWIEQKGFKKIGAVKAAGYNAPFTIPAMRRNEVLIPVEKP